MQIFAIYIQDGSYIIINMETAGVLSFEEGTPEFWIDVSDAQLVNAFDIIILHQGTKDELIEKLEAAGIYVLKILPYSNN